MTAQAHAHARSAEAPTTSAAAPAPPKIQRLSGAVPGLSALPGTAAAVQRNCDNCTAEARAAPKLPGDTSPNSGLVRDLPGTPVQPRLEVGPVDDAYEREADTVAGKVMAMRDMPASTTANPAVQRKCDACTRDEEKPRLRRLAAVPAMLDVKEESVQARREGPAVMRQEDEQEAVQARRESTAVRRVSDEDEAVQPRRIAATVQRQEDEEEAVQARRVPASVQRQDEEEPVQARRTTASVQRQEEEEEAVQARRAAPGVQRGCAGCGQDDSVQRRAPEGGGKTGETIGASAGKLTSGGAPLSEGNRTFFEDRMGHDLSDVRVHRGPEADQLAGSIQARAFTFKNHIWLGGRESEGQTFTMAHEMAHVLQQTAPKPLDSGVQARRAAPRVQRSYWKDLDDKSGTAQKKHGDYGGLLQIALVGQTSNQLISEVRVPTQNRTGTGHKLTCGFTDLYRAKGKHTIPGVEYRDFASGSGFRNIRSTGNCMVSWGGFPMFHHQESVPNASPTKANVKKARKNQIAQSFSSDQIYAKYGRPSIGTGGNFDLQGCNDAATNIEVGEIKPGHNVTERQASGQIGHYKTAFTSFATKVNTNFRQRGGSNADCYTVNASTLDSGVTIPSSWAPSRSGGWTTFDNVGLMRDVSASQTLKPPNNRKIRGRLSASKDQSGNSGVWAYFIEPNPDDLEAAITGLPATDKFVDTNRRVKEVIDELRKRPKAKAKVKPRRRLIGHGGPARPVASRVPVRPLPAGRVQRAKAKDTSFDRKAWDALRMGSKKPAYKKQNARSLEKALSTNYTKAQSKSLEFADIALQANADYARGFGVDAKKGLPKDLQDKNSKQSQNVKAFGKATFWASPDATPIGILRARFGTLFVRVFEGIERLKKQLTQRFRRVKVAKGGGQIAKAARIVGKLVMRGFRRLVMPHVMAALNACMTQTFQKAFDQFTEASGIGPLLQHVETAKATAAKLGEEPFAQVEALYDAAMAKVGTRVEEIGKWLADAGKIVLVIKDIITAARLALCVGGTSTGPGAILTCAVSAIDWVLGKFGVSPIEAVAAKLMRSCGNQRLIASALLSFDKVRTLPKFITEQALAQIKSALPKGLQDVMCDVNQLNVPEIKPGDYKCFRNMGGKKLNEAADASLGEGKTIVVQPKPAGGTDKKGGATEGDQAGTTPSEGTGSGEGDGTTQDKITTADGQISGDSEHSVVIMLSGGELTPKSTAGGTRYPGVTMSIVYEGKAFPGRTVDLYAVEWLDNDIKNRLLKFYLDPDSAHSKFHWKVKKGDESLSIGPNVGAANKYTGAVN